MMRMVRTVVSVFAWAALPATAAAQPFETLGTRATGFGGAFVAVADDASAVYWNPAGLASGAFFSLLVDRTAGTVKLDDPRAGSGRSSVAIALATPPLGLSYYRLRRTYTVAAPDAPTAVQGGNAAAGAISVQSLVTHHAGITVLHSLSDGIAVGATLKLVRGVASSGISSERDRDTLLGDDGDEFGGRGSTQPDADLGIMASLGILRAGLTVRNVRELEFEPAESSSGMKLNRQVRAGLSFLPLQNWLMAVDFDLTRTVDPLGATRNIATGLEGRVHRRATVRGGVRFNTVDDDDRRSAISAGGSFAVFGSTFVDAQVTAGSAAERGWGVSARVLF